MATNNTRKIKQRRYVNIAWVIFLFAFVYLAINILVPLTKTEASIYKVPVSTIYSDSSYLGLVLRSEKMIYTDSEGYINFYYKEGERVSKNSEIYSISADKGFYDYISLSEVLVSPTSNEVIELKQEIQRLYTTADNFEDYENVGSEVLTTYRRLLDNKLAVKINQIIANTGKNSGFKVIKSEVSGIISYQIDDFGYVNESDVKPDMFTGNYNHRSTYSLNHFDNGNVLYKIITDDKWNIIVKVDDEFARELSSKNNISFTINNKQEVNAPFTLVKRDDTNYVVIIMNSYIQNYTKDRYLNISFNTKSAEGLKIPVSSVTYKDFYRIPEYFFVETVDNDGTKKTGLLTEYKGAVGFVSVEIFLEENGYFYISSDFMDSETCIRTYDGSSKVMLYAFLTKLEGAYNLNNGYAVFKRIERIKTTDSYILVKINLPSGLRENDHIALIANKCTEDAVIY